MKLKTMLTGFAVLFSTQSFANLNLVSGDALDIQKTLGTWYTLETNFDLSMACAKSNITQREDGTLLIQESYKVDAGQSESIEQDLVVWVPNENTPRNWVVEFSNNQALPNFFIKVVDLDYNYMVVTNETQTKTWIMSRDQEMSLDLKKDIKSLLYRKGIQTSDLRAIEQLSCDSF